MAAFIADAFKAFCRAGHLADVQPLVVTFKARYVCVLAAACKNIMGKARKGSVFILAVSALAAMTSPVFAQPILVLDSQWNLAYAKSACKSAEIWYKSVGQTAEERLGCENFASCPKMLATVKACRARGAAAALSDFEQQLARSLLADPGCEGIAVVRHNSPGDAAYEKLTRTRDPSDFWTLSVNFAPGAAKQPWHLRQRARDATSGDGAPQAIAAQACALILGRGPKAN